MPHLFDSYQLKDVRLRNRTYMNPITQVQSLDVPSAIAILVPVGYAASPRLDPGRLPFSYNVFVDKLGNPYQG